MNPPVSLPYRTLVVNAVGEPGSGKTTLSFWLSQALKKSGVVTEFVPEVVKYECFMPEGQARVRSGRFDHRYLTLQDRFLRPLAGRVEVIVNDGPYELFYFYARRRMGPEALGRFRAHIDELKGKLPQDLENWFVMPQRAHAYETIGRNETEEEAAAVRREMIHCLEAEFSHRPIHVADERDRLLLLEAIVRRVGELGRGPGA